MDEEQSGAGASDDPSPTALTIEVDGKSHSLHSFDDTVTIGRDPPSQILVAGQGVSRIHVRIEHDGEHWSLVDVGSRNGVYLAGQRIDHLIVDRSIVVHLGDPNGVALTLVPSEDAVEPGSSTHIEEAAERSDDETHLPAGDEEDPETEFTEVLSPTVQVSVAIDAVDIAVRAIRVRAALLPGLADQRFAREVTLMLTELRRLDRTVIAAARNAPGRLEVAVALTGVRRLRAELVLRAAQSPHSSLGQRLIAVRHRGGLTAAEVATTAGVTVADVDAVEAEQRPSDAVVDALERFVTVVGAALTA